MILVIFLPMFFMIFMVFFPLFWALAICGCWFLPLTKFSKVLISVLILAMLCGGIAFLFFDKESRFFSFLFACGFISLPVFLRYFWRSQESYEKYYHIIHTNPLAQNNLKRRAISLFSIGLLGTFMSLWQVEVPQKVVFKVATLIAGNSYPIVEIIDNNVSQDLMWRYGSTKELRNCQDKGLNCPFFNFKFPIYEVHAEVNGTNIVIAIEYNIAYSTSTLTRFLSSIGSTKRIEYQNTYKSVKSILNKGENNGTAK